MMQTWAVVNFGEPLELIELPLPPLEGTQVLVRNMFAGVCHSDLHNWTNDFGIGKTPCTLGHEMEGEVIAVGPDVPADSVRVGGRYLVFPWVGCGSRPKPCRVCLAGSENICLLGNPQGFTDGKSVYGGYGSHVVIPHYRYLIDSAVTSNLPDGIACIYMCSALTAFSALKKIGTPPRGPGDVVVLGCGGVGLQAIQFAKHLFGGLPLAADVSPQARAAAEAMGCKVYDPSDKAQVKQLRKETGGVFAVVDFVGVDATYAFAESIVHRGGTIVLVGLFGGMLKTRIGGVAGMSLTIKGSMTGSLPEAHEMLKAVQAGAVQPIPHQIRDISEVNTVLSELKAGHIVGRCILRHKGVAGNRL